MKHTNAYLCMGLALCFLVLASWTAAAQKAPKCSDIPIRVTIYDTVDFAGVQGGQIESALRSDGGGQYTGTLNICSGTYDAVVNTSGTPRRLFYRFPNALAGSFLTGFTQPSWIPGSYPVSGWINVRNLLYRHSPFTTHMGTTFTGPDRSSYRLAFMPEIVDAPDNHPTVDPATVNRPYSSSPAMVYPQPYWDSVNNKCTSNPSWLVLGNNPPSINSPAIQVGTLYKLANSPKNADTHAGQYSMPFMLLIESQVCFTYKDQ